MNMINDLAAAFYPIPDSGDPFWQQSARSLFIGAVHALMLLKKENPEIPVNLASAHQLIPCAYNLTHPQRKILLPE